MMEVLSGFPEDVLALVWHKPKSEHDVRRNLPPEVRDARAGQQDLRLYAKLQLPEEQQRTLPTLEDLARGVGQWRDVGRIAVVTDEPVFRHMVQFFGPFFHSPIRVFSNAQSHEARTWLRRGDKI